MWLYFLAVQLAGTMVETTTWLNLGDGGSILLFLFVGPGLANARAAITARRKKNEPRAATHEKHASVFPSSQTAAN